MDWLRRLFFKTKDSPNWANKQPTLPGWGATSVSFFDTRKVTWEWHAVGGKFKPVVMFEKFWLRKKGSRNELSFNILINRERTSRISIKNACGYKIVYETEGKTAYWGRNSGDLNDSSSKVSDAFFSETKDSPPRKPRKGLRTPF